MKLDPNYLRKYAGLPVAEAEDASEGHINKEEKLFVDCCACLQDVVKMCDERLKQTLTDEHKSQYTKLKSEVAKACEVMKAHVESYKK